MRRSHGTRHYRLQLPFHPLCAGTGLALVGVASVSPVALAQTINYTGPNNGSFLDAANYDLNGAPDAVDIVGNATANTISLAQGASTINGLSSTGTGGVTIGQGGTLSAASSGSSTLTIAGQLRLTQDNPFNGQGGQLIGFVISSPNAVAFQGNNHLTAITSNTSLNLDNGILTVDGGLTLNGTGTAARISGGSTLQLAGFNQLRGSGQVEFASNNSSNRVSIGNGLLVNNATITTSAGARGEIVSGNLINIGTIAASGREVRSPLAMRRSWTIAGQFPRPAARLLPLLAT